MEREGIELHLTPLEVEEWTTALLRAATLIGMNPAYATGEHRNRMRETLAAMAYRLDCEVVRRAAWDAEPMGEEGVEYCVTCGAVAGFRCRLDGRPYCGPCGTDRVREREGSGLATLPAEWPE